ncbi:FAD assembly factor SdhE [Candidatus Venteria ishoeyi]|uniref:FAD assembly factor SdhE n=1 Tax=Candidatus Venteria ishoeyi TaxID=1899563 RepID=A0A1H6F9T0_9GAMM|nr:succinate dehydrogenase assembly factor 2 [Candidatus Venteria ishoeyi]MDM8546903.1 succinate dehydrogenase assembly factor 2 [Candidatus Venteria ishoeyi]SEH06860.1 Antitoxin CptB [Candidatus Venteria ishoeyi]
MNTLAAAHEYARLRWSCRRGMKELDEHLLAYLTQVYQYANQQEQQQFVKLLAQSDIILYQWLILQQTPENLDFQVLLSKINLN